MSALPFRNKKPDKKISNRNQDPVDLLTESELLSWLSDHTEWADDYDPDTHRKEILAIHEAERHEDQVWKVATKRRRDQNGIMRLEDVEIADLNQFPSIDRLERLVQAEGYGGGAFTITNTRGKKRNHRIELSGEPEDPLVSPVQVEGPAFKDRLRSMLEETALRYLHENPYELSVVTVRWLEQELGIKIPMPTRPDPDAPVPYVDLPPETRKWLDEHPEDRDLYIRSELCLESPEPEETIEDRMVRAMEEQVVSDIASGKSSGPSELSTALGGFVEGTKLPELIKQLADTFPGVFSKLVGSAGLYGRPDDDPDSDLPRLGESTDQSVAG